MLRDQAGSAREALTRTQQVMTSWGSHSQRGKDRGSGCPPRALRVPWLLVRPAPYHKDGHWYLGRARQRRAYSGSRPGSVTSWSPVTWEAWPEVSDIGHPFINQLVNRT